MTRYTSGDKLNLKIGIESYSENLTSLEVIGTAEIDGDINVSAGNSITAPEYYGDGSNLTGITLNQVSDAIGGITVQEEGVDVGTTNGITNINFVSGNLTATGSGIGATITLTDTPSFTTITGNLTGTATTATNADNIEVNQNTGNTFKNVVFVNGTDGNLKPQVNTSIQVQPSTGILTASEFHGDGSNLTGLSAGQVGAMTDLVSDIDPELGGDLDLNNNDITGTGNINITGVITATSFSGDITGTATTATQIETSRNFSVSGDVATASNVSFDGTGNVDLAVTLSNNFSANTTGIITASEFYGDGSNLTGLSAGQVGALAGVTIRDEDVVEGSVGGVGDINFVGNYITATASGAGATITLSDISLGTDTTGNYVESISGTANEIQISNGSGEGSTPQIGLPNNVTISNNLSVSGNLNVTGTLTYEDVTNVDSIGIVTARSGIDAEGDINVSAGNSITAPKYYGDGSNLTGLSAGQVGAMADLVSDIDPELGGDLDLNNFDITGTGNVNINGSITATSFSGDGSGVTGVITATNADNIEVNQNTGNTFKNVVFVNGIDGNLKPQVISSIQVQASSGILTATKLSGDGSLITGLSATQVGAMTDLVSDIDPELGGDLDLNNNDITGTGNINITGVITATSFSGDGSNLTGLSAGQVGAMTDLVSDIDPELGGDLDLNNNDITGTGNINITGVITATSFDGTLATSDLSGTITNAQLAGSIANSKLVNSSVSFGGVSVNLGGSNAQPAFDLTNATNYPYSSLTGTPTIPTDNDQLTNGAGYITSFDITTQTDPKYLRSDANDVYTGTLTGAGNISFSGTKIEIGDGSGSVAMTINDGYGNANLCFNHAAGRPDVNGNALRIETNVDSTTNANFVFEGKSNVTANTATALNQLFTMSETGATCLGNTVWHAGNDGSGSGLDADKLDDQEGSYYLDYNNFTNTPTIPTNNNVLTNGAGFITSSDNITGTASTATTITISSNNDSTAYRVPYTSSNSGNVSLYVDNSDGMTYNPGTNTLSAGSFSGNGSNLTGVVKTTGDQTIAGIKTFTDDVYVDGLSAITIGVTYLTGTTITGNLSGNVTGNVTGTANTATNADNIEVDDNSSTTFRNIVTVIGTNGYRKPQVNNSIQAQLSSGTIKATLFSGSGASLNNIPYSSLTGTPTIPTNNNQLTNGAGYITDITTQTDPKYLRSDDNDTASGNISFTSTTTPITTNAILFNNTENDGNYYTDASGILAFDENFYGDANYGTGTYDPDTVFTGGNGGGILIKNQDGWGAVFTTQNTRWATAEWDGLTVGGNRVLTVADEGSGNGLDADLLDSQNGSYYLDYANFTGTPTIPTNNNQLTNGAGYITDITTQTDPKYLRSDANDTLSAIITGHASNTEVLRVRSSSYSSNYIYIGGWSSANSTDISRIRSSSNLHIDSPSDGSLYFNWYAANRTIYIGNTGQTVYAAGTNIVWHAGNDGAGSGLDADTVDGIQGSALAPIASPTFTGNLTIPSAIVHAGDTDTYIQFHGNDLFRVVIAGAEVQEWGNNYTLLSDNDTLRLGSGSDFRMWFNGADTFFRNYAHANGDIIFQGENSAGTNQNILIMKTDSTRTYNILYENSQERLRTTSGGVTVTGNIAVTGTFSGSGASLTNVNAATVSVNSITSGATERPVYFNDGTTTSGNGVLRMDGSPNGMRYRADQNRLILSNLTVVNAVSGNLNGNATTASTATLASTVTVSSTNVNSNHRVAITEGTGSKALLSDGQLLYNPSTNVLTSGTFSGSGASLTNIPADQLTGTINDARLPATITSNITGSATSATSATNATNLDIRSRNSNTATHYVTFATSTSGNQRLNSDTGLTYNPSSNTLTTGTVVANLSGNATTSSSCTGNAASATIADTIDIIGSGNTTNTRYPLLASTTGGQSSPIVDGDLRYTPSNNTLTAGVFSGSGASLTNIPADQLTGTINDARLPATITSNITGTSVGCEDTGILSLLSTGQAVQIRGNPSTNLSRVYRFGKPNANATEVFFNLNSITADRTFTWPDGGGTIALTSSSDRRLKTNISNITSQSALDFVNNISPVTFNWKTDIHNGQSHAHSQSAGYIAQQLVAAGYSYMLDTTPMEEDFIEKELYFTHDKTEVDPETGVNNPEDSYYTMNYDMATPFLHKALVDALTKIDELQARIVALENN